MSKMKTNKDRFQVVKDDLPADLSAQVQSIRAFATVHNVLMNGQFTYANFAVVSDCIAFMKSIHEQAVKVALEHPSADLVPELKLEKEKNNAASQENNAN